MGTAPIDGEDSAERVSDDSGIIPRACIDLFHQIKMKCDGNSTVEMSYLEVYNEEVRDLLLADDSGGDRTPLRIRENLDGEVYVRGLTSRVVRSAGDVGAAMKEASGRRVVAATKMNAESSRSHAICVLSVSGVLDDSADGDSANTNTKFQSKLTLVDLAGSERIKKTGAKGDRAAEGISINKGLFVLGQVVSALAEQRPKVRFIFPVLQRKLKHFST